MSTRTICIVTGSRAEYGLLHRLMREISEDPDLALRLVVTGSHLAPSFHMTIDEIVADGFLPDDRVDILLDSDSGIGMAKAVGLGMLGFAESYRRLAPDIVVVFGDRFEMLAAASAATLMRLPVAHIGGGELTEGALDDSIRHAITKLAHLHFPAIEDYARRIRQMGEDPQRVFVVGTPGLDNILHEPRLSRDEWEAATGFSLGARNLLVTFHPPTLSEDPPERQMAALLAALDRRPACHVIVTLPNADSGGRALMAMAEDWCRANAPRARAFGSLGRLRYLSALALVDAVVGNSSSGIIEVPSFGIGTVNIGDRQDGRPRTASVIDCPPETSAILAAMDRVLSPDFQAACRNLVNPFGDGLTAPRIKEILKSVDTAGLTRKLFFDLGGLVE